MKKMKKTYLIFFVAIFMQACDFLDIVPDDTPLLDDAFKNERTTEGFVYSCYNRIPNYLNFRQNFSWFTTPEVVGSAHWEDKWFDFIKMQEGKYNPSSPVIDVWRNSYEGIRQCYIFLNNVDKTVPAKITEEELDEKKQEWIGEVKFLIAYYHYLLLQNYGPIVIVEDEIAFSSEGENFFMARSSYDESVEAIAKMFDDAIEILPSKVSSVNYGRATSVAAQALKARMYVYAASPLFNGNSILYSNFKNKDGKQLISQNYDKNKWIKALEETEKAISMAEEAGAKLYRYQGGSGLSPFEQAVANIRHVVVDPWNEELLWGYSGWKEPWGHGNSIQTHIIPTGISPNAKPWGALGATLTSASLFLTENGLPMDGDDDFDYEKRFTVEAGEELPILHKNREPRFYASLGFDRGDLYVNSDTIKLYMKYQEQHGARDPQSGQLYGSYAIQKLIHPQTEVSSTSNSLVSYPFPIVRLGELYLSYAEAYAEINSTLEGKALDYFNAIRQRAGIPNVETAYNGMPSGDELQKAIRRERTVELMFEGHMYYDYRRWLIAEDEFTKFEMGMIGLNSYGTTNEDYFKEAILDRKPFIFVSPKMYLSPIKQDYINVNHNLVQNPGW